MDFKSQPSLGGSGEAEGEWEMALTARQVMLGDEENQGLLAMEGRDWDAVEGVGDLLGLFEQPLCHQTWQPQARDSRSRMPFTHLSRGEDGGLVLTRTAGHGHLFASSHHATLRNGAELLVNRLFLDFLLARFEKAHEMRVTRAAHGQSSEVFSDAQAIIDFDVPSHGSEDLVRSVGMHV